MAEAPPSPRQQRKGPAPFASFEDMSDEYDSSEDKPAIRLEEITEESKSSTPKKEPSTKSEVASTTSGTCSLSQRSVVVNLQTPSTPRIDISRASSSSHHDSRDSSPEMALFAGKEKDSTKIGLGFKEEGALDLRSSTEELAFLEPNTATCEKETPKTQARKSPVQFKDDRQHHNRKDSQCSDIVLLSISGRTSRLSSIGSQGSGVSNVSGHISVYSNVSHISGHSRLSVISGASRSPSPHKMLLETSFCGPKPLESEVELVGDSKHENEVLEHVILSKKFNPNEAILLESLKPTETSEKVATVPTKQALEKRVSLPSDQVSKAEANGKITKKAKPPPIGSIKSSSKGETEYTRIRLKPDHMYDSTDSPKESVQKPVTLNLTDHSKKQAPHFKQLIQSDEEVVHHSKNDKIIHIPLDRDIPMTHLTTPRASPKPGKRATLKEENSRTPSPAGHGVSRKSSFCSLFRSRENVGSPDSPTSAVAKRKSSRSRSKSRERDKSVGGTPTSASKIKGSVLALFKPQKKTTSESPISRESSASTDSRLQPAAQPARQPKSEEKKRYYDSTADVIRIPLHTPAEEKDFKSMAGAQSSYDDDSVITILQVEQVPLSPRKTTPEKTKIQKTVNEKKAPAKSNMKNEILPDGSIRIPLHSPSEDRLVRCDLMTEEQKETIRKQCSNITTKPSSTIKTLKEDARDKKEKKEQLNEEKAQSSKANDKPPQISREKSNDSSHITFVTKVGSKEQLFSTRLSLSKTDSQCSQFSEAQVISEEVVVETYADKNQSSDETLQKSTSIDSKSDMSGKVIEVDIENTVVSPNLSKQASDEKPQQRQLTQISSIDDAGPDSSGSERDNTEMENMRKRQLQAAIQAEQQNTEYAIETKQLVLQQDSFDEDLPYVPTTLPQERSVAIPIIPVKERHQYGVKTYPLDRPRSTTPINPSCLEEYVEEAITPDSLKAEKLKISLPKETVLTEKSKAKQRTKSPRRISSTSSSSKAWHEFAEQGITHASRRLSSESEAELEAAPALPPRVPVSQAQWINFEKLPEKRKMPKRIQTIPSRGSADVPDVVYNYVNPEDCKCECHEGNKTGSTEEATSEREDDEEPLLDDAAENEGLSAPVVEHIKVEPVEDGKSLRSDSSLEYSYNPDAEASASLRIGKPFTMDLDVSSNRSSIVSQEGCPSHCGSPRNGAPRPGFD